MNNNQKIHENDENEDKSTVDIDFSRRIYRKIHTKTSDNSKLNLMKIFSNQETLDI